MPSHRPPYDDGSKRATDERTASEKPDQAKHRRPAASRPENRPGYGLDDWATFRMPKVTDGPITGSFPVDVTGMPTMQLPALPSALPRDIFPPPVWKLPQ